MNYAIEMSGVGWRAGKAFELSDLTLRVPVGSIYGFLGPNGSGKTTTIRMFLGMMRPDRGEIRVLGKQVPKDMRRILARVGFVPEGRGRGRVFSSGPRHRLQNCWSTSRDSLWRNSSAGGEPIWSRAGPTRTPGSVPHS